MGPCPNKGVFLLQNVLCRRGSPGKIPNLPLAVYAALLYTVGSGGQATQKRGAFCCKGKEEYRPKTFCENKEDNIYDLS